MNLDDNMNLDDTEESKDLLGRTYEYCIEQFADSEMFSKSHEFEGIEGNRENFLN